MNVLFHIYIAEGEKSLKGGILTKKNKEKSVYNIMNLSFPLEGGGKLHKGISLVFYWVPLFCIFLPLKLAVLFASAGLPIPQCQNKKKKTSQVSRRKSTYSLLLIKSLFSLEKLFMERTLSVQNKPIALPATAYSCMLAHLFLTCHSPGAEETKRKLFSSSATS